jgi:hypothetical protein
VTQTSIRIYVDADACPVKDEIYKVSRASWLASHRRCRRIHPRAAGSHDRAGCSRKRQDAADNWIVERAGPMSIVVTFDIPLASRCIKLGATVIAPDGRILTEASIGMALAERNLLHDLRSAGESTSGPPPFKPSDRSAFLSALDQTIRRMQRGRQVG